MEFKKLKIILYIKIIIFILIIIYYSFLPVLQNKFYKKEKIKLLKDEISHIDYNHFLFKINTSEKNFIVYDNITNINNLFENNPQKYERSFKDSILYTEDFLNNQSIYINPDIYIMLANSYFIAYKEYGDEEFLKTQNIYLQKAIALAPHRVDLIYAINLNTINSTKDNTNIKSLHQNKDLNKMDYYFMGLMYFYTNDKEKSLSYLEKFFESNGPNYFMRSNNELTDIYYNFMKYFYTKKDKENFLLVLKRLEEKKDQNNKFLNSLISHIENTNTLPKIKLDY